ncbi:MAG: DUF4982 domain-containing protein [Clostridia bacterium]|nr:DUF4982 domain-containing protein [Clostridia bacterium]
MNIIDFNAGWEYRKSGDENRFTPVTLPHDAMIFENRSADSDGGMNVAWFEGGDYEYRKRFFVPEEYSDKILTFEFEGVYRNAEVYINGAEVARHPYGYTGFFVEARKFLNFGKENEITVFAKNSDQPNSRWYSGAGIYRPVKLYVADAFSIKPDGIRIKTVEISPAEIEVGIAATASGKITGKVLFEGKTKAEFAADTDETGKAKVRVKIPDAKLWNVYEPNLYACALRFENDARTVRFGIRKTEVSAEKGFLINGERVIIRGACIHHDNGILGARCYPEAERRKIKILSENGYNAVRSAHNPCSKALLDACDELGVLVLDEYCDCWYIHKTKYDYASELEKNYEADLADMIGKDFNHPSVIGYSLGNEVAETASKRGVDLFKKMKDVCKKHDPDRFVTVGVNIFFNLLYVLGFGQYSDKKAEKNPQKKVGSEFFNDLAGRLGAGFMKKMAKLHACDAVTRKCFAEADVAGYNYGILRYKKDIKKYPERVILGTETFCADAYSFYETAKKHPSVIGDFVWAGMDYLGEVGVGSWEYKEYAPSFVHGAGWISAGSGRIDLTGTPLGEALYTKVAFEKEDKPQIAVVPVCGTGKKHSPSAWKFSNAVPSWSWNGLDGALADVEVYSRAPVVELYVNGKKVGAKKFRRNCVFRFRTRYYGGEITAINIDGNGREISRNSLKTAKEGTFISVIPEKPAVAQGEICFVKIRYTDEDGILKPLERGEIKAEVSGGELLAFGSACPYNERGYNGNAADTYYGEVTAVVRANDAFTLTAYDAERRGSATVGVIRTQAQSK